MAQWLVTGGAGFIGSHLVEALIMRGDRVVVLDNLSTGRPENLPRDAELIQGDILDADLVARSLAGAQGVYHLAATVSVQECVQNLIAAHQVNLTGTLIVLEAARHAGNRPVVFASSAAVYGDQGERACSEDLRPDPISPYGADKLACEHHARAFHRIHGLPSAALRFFNVYGPRQDPRSPYAGVISRFADNVRLGRPHTIYGDGGQTRDFVNVADVVKACLAAQELLARAPQTLVSNVCTGGSVSLLELVAAIDDLMGGAITPVEHEPARAGDIRHSLGDSQQMALSLRSRADVKLRDGLAQLLA